MRRLHLTTARLVAILGLALLMVLAASPPAVAATLELDHFSFLHVPSTGLTESLDSTITIPVAFSSKPGGGYRIRVDNAAFAIPPMSFSGVPNAAWSLEFDATGLVLLPSEPSEEPILKIFAVFTTQLHVDAPVLRIPVAFTTEQAARSEAHVIAEREGEPVDPASGYTQFVGVGTIPADSPYEPNRPFYIVLSGRLTGAPF